MDKLIIVKPDIDIQESEYKRLLGYPSDYKIEGRANELIEWAKEWYSENGKPWIYTKQFFDLKLFNDGFKIDDSEFSSKKICKQFFEAKVEAVNIAIVSAGAECEDMAQRLWQEGKPDQYFFLEIFGSAVVEHLISLSGFYLCEWAEEKNLAVLPHYSPGYPGWNIKDQVNLFELIKNKAEHNMPINVRIFETGMLYPKKSQLALFGITNQVENVRKLTELIPCESCSLRLCSYRRKPYKHFRKLIEDVHELQRGNSNNILSERKESFQTNYSAEKKGLNYTINPKTLKKWSKEKLELNFMDEGFIEATFKYDGTTCSNLGHPLEFDFFLKLAPSDDSYLIIDLHCKPSNGDDGYRFMCDYIKDEHLLKVIVNEKPLLGKSLNNALNWKRGFSPEGCFCKHESRMHKWGLVFEVVHFTLSQYKNEFNSSIHY